MTSLAALKSSAAKASAMAISLPSSLPCILACGTADASLLFPVPFGAQPCEWLDARDESTLALTAGGESVQTTAVRHAWARRPTPPTWSGWVATTRSTTAAAGSRMLYDNYLIYSSSMHSLTV